MNKYEKAIKFYEENKKVLNEHFTDGVFKREAMEAAETAIEALRKQVPRALRGYKILAEDGICPKCGRQATAQFPYCVCGQAIGYTLSECVASNCFICAGDGDKTVCSLYAAKVDEIRRIHEEAYNDR